MLSEITVAFRDRLGDFRLDASFRVPAQGVTALVGPSGCGKTTVLRCIAGLHRAADGLCRIGQEDWQREALFRPAHRRPVGYVFQEASLFAHLCVRRNLLFGAPPAITAGMIGFDEVIALLGLDALLGRRPRHLSGGERQRVAIGRALLSQPRLLLMDEPLSALDAATKGEILPYLERLQSTLRLPMIYVSHDMAEVERLADTLVLMAAGRVVASGPIAGLQSDPTLPLMRAERAAVSFDAVMIGYDETYRLGLLAVGGARFLVPMADTGRGTRHRLRIEASDVSLARDQPPLSTITNIVPAQIRAAMPTGPHDITVVLDIGDGAQMLARITRRSWDLLGLAAGHSVYAQIKAVSLAAKG